MPRPPNTHARRGEIARAMVSLLARHGMAGATMRALSAHTGLTQGLLHYHFPGKHEMVVAALEEIEARLGARVAAASAGGDALRGLVDALLAPPREDLPADAESLAAWVAIGDAAQADAQVRVAYGDALARLHRQLVAAIGARAEACGRTLAPGQAEALAGAALSSVEGAWRIGRVAPWAMPAGVAARSLTAMLEATLGQAVALPVAVGGPPMPPRPPVPAPSVRLRGRQRLWWDAVVAASPVELPDSTWSAIAAAYTLSNRHYHSLEHLAEMARAWREVAEGPGWQDPVAAWIALLFHDAVQDRVGPPGSDEQRSAALLCALVPASVLPDPGPAAALVRLTATHGHPPEGLAADAAHFLDCDMAILGASPARFARYERQIAAEYAPVVPLELFRVGRRAFLEALARSPRIFHSDHFHARLEARARANLAAALG